MQNDLFTNVLMLLAIFFLIFIIFSTMNFGYKKKEGFGVDASNNSTTSNKSSNINGYAGNAQYYTSGIKDKVIKLQDTLLLSKYRSDYENIILGLDDLVDNLMLEKVLTITSDNTQKSLEDLVTLNNSKIALNNVMKFIDSSSS
jgi:hypothetical protein